MTTSTAHLTPRIGDMSKRRARARSTPPSPDTGPRAVPARGPSTLRPSGPLPPSTAAADALFARIFAVLRTETGVDFGDYRRNTTERRVQRRIVANRLAGLEEYVEYLEKEPSEAHALLDDLLILTTRFFREPPAFDALRRLVFPAILEHHPDGEPIRVWSAGCSTGEEAYSLAIALLEYLEECKASHPITVFATDLSARAITRAREGMYPRSIARDVSAARLGRFFTTCEGGYRIAEDVRRLCLFAHADLTREPPYGHLDLVLCRNVLIYMGIALQIRVLGLFHWALRSRGFLMLGSSETVGRLGTLFEVISKEHRIYRVCGSGTPEAAAPDVVR